jgi:hypothetical protein
MLLPQLGAYVGHEPQVPYDLDDLLACVAPKPVLVVTPEHDRHAPLAKVTPAIDHARKTYDLYRRGELLIHKTPDTINTFDTQIQTSIVQWLSFRAGQQPTTAPAADH